MEEGKARVDRFLSISHLSNSLLPIFYFQKISGVRCVCFILKPVWRCFSEPQRR